MWPKNWSKVVFLVLFLLPPCLNAGSQRGQVENDAVSLDHDDSDWWSKAFSEKLDVTTGEKGLAPGTLQIADISIRTDFEEIAAKLGKAVFVGRNFRNQVCYVSDAPGQEVHLIFEVDELGSNFYLFTGGEDWNGSNLCFKTRRVSMRSHTGSGLRLGLLPSEMQSILGPPDAIDGDTFAYSRSVLHKRSPAEFAELRNMYPRLAAAALRS
jgi:hypothetical protein